MLEQMRKQGATSFLVYLIFGVLIVIFVINFAPNAGQGGCNTQGATAYVVDGQKVNHSSFKMAFELTGGKGTQKMHATLEMLLRREILAIEAEARGIRVNDAIIDEEIKKGYLFLGGRREKVNYWFGNDDDPTVFNIAKLKGFQRNLNVSMKGYKDDQKRNMQAALMAEIMMDSVRVSRDEAMSDFLFAHNTVTYDAVTFSATPYRAAMRLTDADVQRFIATHEAEIKAKFTADERSYKATKPAFKLRQILIAKSEPASPGNAPAPTPAPDGAGSGSAPAPTPAPVVPTVVPAKVAPGMPTAEATAKLEAARAAIVGGKKFADVAKELTTDDAAKAMGGYVGWRPVDAAALGDQAVSDAVKALKAGEMTPVIAGEAGVYLVFAEEKREGDLSYDQVKYEIAVDLARDVWSKEAAKRAALAAFASTREGTGKNIDQLFSADPEEVQRKMQEDMQRQIQEQMQKMQMQQKQGRLMPPREEGAIRDVPASWFADADGSSAKGSGSAAPATGSTAPAAGAGSGSAALAPTTTAAPAAAPATTLTASTDTLPAFADVKAPFLSSYGPVPRFDNLPAIGENKAAIDAMFDELAVGGLGKQVYEVKDTYVLLQVKNKETGKVDDFDKTADTDIETMRLVRGMMMVEKWLGERCRELAKDGRLSPAEHLIGETNDKGERLPSTYKPCSSFE